MLPRAGAVFAVLVLSALSATCDKVPLTAPSNATIKLYASTPVVPLNGTAQITATVVQGGGLSVHNGTLVSFTTSLGTIEPSEATTRDGKVTVTFRAGSQSGTATVNAYSGAASTGGTTGTTTGGTNGTGTTTGTTSGGAVTLLVGSAAAASVVVTAAPGTVPGTGGTSLVTATVLDANNNALAGVPVSFSTDVGTVSPVTSTTNQNGEATTTLNTYQTSTVTATAGPKITGTTKVTATATPTITITPPTTTPSVGVSANFTVNVAVGTGGAPITRATIDFGDGSTLSLGAVNGSITVPHTYKEAGSYVVTVTTTDASGQTSSASVPVDVFPAVPFTLTMSASSGRVNTPITITATPPVGAPVIVEYTWNVGGATTSSPSGIIRTSTPTVTVTYPSSPCGTGVTGPCTVQINVTATGADGRIGFGSTTTTITP